MEFRPFGAQFTIRVPQPSAAKRQPSADELRRVLLLLLDPLVEKYGKKENEKSPGDVLRGLIRRAYEQTGKQIAVIIDEYDAPLLDVLHESQQLDQLRNVMQEFYVQLKASEAMVKFCFITGITKFSQLSIFSTINNLRNVSMEPAFATGNIGNYWFASGTPSFLFQQMRKYNTNILELDKLEVTSSQFDVPTEAMTSALPLLYQSGYLTIKDYNPYAHIYTLDFPNAEVKVGFLENFMVTMMGVTGHDTQGFAGRFYYKLLQHDIDGALRLMQSFFASIPYLDHGNRDFDELTRFEAYYEVLMYVVFSIFNCRTYTEVKTALGKADVVVFMNDATYVMEIKIGGTAQEALEQIDTKEYAVPYEGTGLPVVKIGIAFSRETRTVNDCVVG